MTDLTKWKLFVDRGRQIWKYMPSSDSVQTVVDKYLLGLDVVCLGSKLHILFKLTTT
jgi:hypothetical protein